MKREEAQFRKWLYTRFGYCGFCNEPAVANLIPPYRTKVCIKHTEGVK